MKLSLAFVTAGLAAFSATSAAAIEARSNSHGSNIDVTILNYALTLEYLEAFFYKQALARFDDAAFAKEGYEPQVRQRLIEIGAEEQIHANTLKSVLGKKATSPCKYSFPYNTVTEFLGLSAVIEGVGVSAYLGAAPLITSKDYLLAAASILTVEARHQSTISTYLGLDPVAGAFDTPLDFSQVYTLAAPFITSCPKGNPKLPVVAFPALTIKTQDLKAGGKIQFSFKTHKKACYYAHFLNGLNDTVMKLDSHNAAKVPKGLMGRTYVVVTSTKNLSDKTTVAGPAYFDLSSPDRESI